MYTDTSSDIFIRHFHPTSFPTVHFKQMSDLLFQLKLQTRYFTCSVTVFSDLFNWHAVFALGTFWPNKACCLRYSKMLFAFWHVFWHLICRWTSILTHNYSAILNLICTFSIRTHTLWGPHPVSEMVWLLPMMNPCHSLSLLVALPLKICEESTGSLHLNLLFFSLWATLCLALISLCSRVRWQSLGALPWTGDLCCTHSLNGGSRFRMRRRRMKRTRKNRGMAWEPSYHSCWFHRLTTSLLLLSSAVISSDSRWTCIMYAFICIRTCSLWSWTRIINQKLNESS